MIARPRAVGEDFNIGNPANTLTILQLAHQVIGLTGRTVPIQLTESPFPDIEIRVPSLSKAREILEYQPNYDLDRGLNSTIAWYREHLSFFESRFDQTATSSEGFLVAARAAGPAGHVTA